MAASDMRKEGSIDRLAMRGRPEGTPLMQQRWDNLLFLHWAVDPALVRPLIPETLTLDLYDNMAWITISPFGVDQIQAKGLPPIPGLKSFNELNLRTYVIQRGEAGVWFFSLDASKTLPAMAARALYGLPYNKARIQFLELDRTRYSFSSRRRIPMKAEFDVEWQVGQRLRDPAVNSLAFFLIERYALYSLDAPDLFQARVYHPPYILEEALVESYRGNLFSSLGLPEPEAEPLAHFCRGLDVEIWPPVRVGSGISGLA